MKLRNQTNSVTRWGSNLARQALRTAVIGVGLLASVAVWASPLVTYVAVDVAGPSWRYDYTITGPVDRYGGIDLVFDYVSYANLASNSSDPSIIINSPDPITNLNGDVFAAFGNVALADGSSALFSVSFDWSGIGAPGSQGFNIFDEHGDSAGSGNTTVTGSTTSPLPEPSDAALAAVALFAALSLTRPRAG